MSHVFHETYIVRQVTVPPAVVCPNEGEELVTPASQN